MNKRLLLSLITVILTVAGLTGATLAFFSQGKVLAGNTFATGNVSIGDFNYTNLTLTNLTPGVPVTISNFAVYYTGSINADLYAGARGTSSPTDKEYFADKLYLRIFHHGDTTPFWTGFVKDLSNSWVPIASNTAAGWQSYDLEFTLDSGIGNDKQGITNSDTQILVYAVQTGGDVPSVKPWETILPVNSSIWPW